MEQLRNAVGDVAEIVGKDLAEAMASVARKMLEDKEKWEKFFKTQVDGWAEVLSGMKSVREVTSKMTGDFWERSGFGKNAGASYGTFGGGITGLGAPAKVGPRIENVPELAIAPKGMQKIAEMRAYERRVRELNKFTGSFLSGRLGGGTQRQTEAALKAKDIRTKYLPAIEREIELTGKVGEAHYHAAKMVEFENDLKKSGIAKTREGVALIGQMEFALKRLERAQRLAKVADSIGDAFGRAFERMIFQGGKVRDMLADLGREITTSVFRQLIIAPIAAGVAGIAGKAFGLTPATELHRGGTVGQSGVRRMVPAMAFAGAPRLHNGLNAGEFPAILERGERVTPKGGGSGVVINIHNETGAPMEASMSEAYFDGDNLVVDAWIRAYHSGGRLRDLVDNIK
jgi:hypothetical protein